MATKRVGTTPRRELFILSSERKYGFTLRTRGNCDRTEEVLPGHKFVSLVCNAITVERVRKCDRGVRTMTRRVALKIISRVISYLHRRILIEHEDYTFSLTLFATWYSILPIKVDLSFNRLKLIAER